MIRLHPHHLMRVLRAPCRPSHPLIPRSRVPREQLMWAQGLTIQQIMGDFQLRIQGEDSVLEIVEEVKQQEVLAENNR